MSSQSGPENTPQPTDLSQDLRAAGLAALTPLTVGLLLLDGYILLDEVGVVLAVLAAGGALFWWRRRHGRWFPPELSTRALVGVAVVAAVLTAFTIL
ncbi:hypothetical protein [Streptoalloteichus tenebrarius]|uniref:hypothetical protein n=1 Tax=Streptoalloteichus tenebrarius (strain ATCC 17920 / DSM 40477 / JCM 4838 / CBS 697.72 / NBRC 16177 / NCIMB 11028 / NRRL B-12390 / A12253. 1 / ISP 5477) TaxID=1933 RepID=UPI0020A51F9D|nr:hypothetical protein [Streptoalloteichus tenebrarius]BFF00606.1 hypothetical protein GCM10020241_22810 [Streptoalloteichus tenebrarius]